MRGEDLDVKVLKKSATPVCMLPSGKLVAYKTGNILIYQNGGIERKIQIFPNFKEKYLGRNRYLYRLFRLGIRAAYALDNNHILISKGNHIFELDIQSGTLSNGFFCGQGIRPLIFSEVNNIPGFKDGVYFGGYLGNMDKKSVPVFRRIDVDKWEMVYTFPQGAINHVHNIVADKYRDCLWIFTGDFDKASGIWKVTDNFRSVEYLVGGNQKFRGCVVFALPEGLLYATDAPFADNHIYMLDPNTKLTKPLHDIHGSCIYGCQWRDDYVFSSTVEGDGRNMSRKEFYFGRKKGAGIKDDYIHMYKGTPDRGFIEIYKEKKDTMPFYTFQFGVFKFPYGNNKSDVLYFQPIATKKHDLSIMELRERR